MLSKPVMKTCRYPAQVANVVRGIFVYVMAAMVAFTEGVAFANPHEDIRLLHVMRPKSALQITTEIIMNAKEYVDVIVYHHDSTPSTLLLLEALRLASARGVRVRYLYDEVASITGAQPLSSSYLALLKAAGVEIRSLTVGERLKKWGPFSIIHSKLLVADIGDGVHDVIKMEGRNAGDRYSQWLDNSYILRLPRTSKIAASVKGYVDHILGMFEVSNPKFTEKPRELIAADEADLRFEVKNYIATPTSEKETEDFKKYLKTGESREFPLFHLNSNEISFVSSGKMNKIYDLPSVDTLSKSFLDLFEKSKKVDVSTILFYLSDDKRQMIQKFLKNGGSLEILSNSEKSFSSTTQNESGVVNSSLTKMQDNEITKLSTYGPVTAHLFDSKEFIFHHSKFVVGEQGVVISSSNFNYSSDIQSEEAGFYIRSKEFTSYMKRYANGIKERFFTRHEYKNGKKMNLVEKSCSIILRNVF